MIFIFITFFFSLTNSVYNDRPIIGIVAMTKKSIYEDLHFQKNYIAASYVKYIESMGARVVPV